MLVRHLIALAVLVTAGTAYADVQDIFSMQIRPDRQFDVVCQNGSREVRSAAELKQGTVCVTESGGGGGGDAIRTTCVSRDNDGRNPWALAVVVNGAILSQPNAIYESETQCQAASANKKSARGFALACASKDRDGKAPFAVALVTPQGQTSLSAAIYASIEECEAGVSGSVTSGTALDLCASRDGDGRNPWAIFTANASGITKQATTFNDENSCVQALAVLHN